MGNWEKLNLEMLDKILFFAYSKYYRRGRRRVPFVQVPERICRWLEADSAKGEGKCAPESDEGKVRGSGFKYLRPVSPVTGFE